MNKFKDSDIDESSDIENSFYYGEIPSNMTKELLVDIMSQAIIKFHQHHPNTSQIYESYKCYPDGTRIGYGQILTITGLDHMSEILDRFFEHDAYSNDEFDHLVDSDNFDAFCQII